MKDVRLCIEQGEAAGAPSVRGADARGPDATSGLATRRKTFAAIIEAIESRRGERL